MMFTQRSRTGVVLFSKSIDALRSKRTGGFSPHTIHWRHRKTSMTKRIYLNCTSTFSINHCIVRKKLYQERGMNIVRRQVPKKHIGVYRYVAYKSTGNVKYTGTGIKMTIWINKSVQCFKSGSIKSTKKFYCAGLYPDTPFLPNL